MRLRAVSVRWSGSGASLGAAAAVLLAGCGSSGPPSGRTHNLGTIQSSCRASQLRPGVGPRISEPTGQLTVVFTITNLGSGPCNFRGYPNVRLEDSSGHVLSFHYRDMGDQVITGNAARTVGVGPGATAYVAINKYRCDLRDQGISREAVVVPPGLNKPLNVTLPQYPVLAFCGPGQPGSIVDVSPVEPSALATRAHA